MKKIILLLLIGIDIATHCVADMTDKKKGPTKTGSVELKKFCSLLFVGIHALL